MNDTLKALEANGYTLRPRLRAVLDAMIPDQPISTTALAARLAERGTAVKALSPVLSELADAGYLRADKRAQGRGYNWTRLRTRTIGRIGDRQASPRTTTPTSPLTAAQAELDAILAAAASLKLHLGRLEELAQAIDRIKGL